MSLSFCLRFRSMAREESTFWLSSFAWLCGDRAEAKTDFRHPVPCRSSHGARLVFHTAWRSHNLKHGRLGRRTMARRFPRPRKVERIEGGYKVLDANGQALAYVYGQTGDTSIAKTLTLDEARRIAANIVKLPELLATQKRSPGA